MKCKKCGYEFPSGVYCPECGYNNELSDIKEHEEKLKEIEERVGPITFIIITIIIFIINYFVFHKLGAILLILFALLCIASGINDEKGEYGIIERILFIVWGVILIIAGLYLGGIVAYESMKSGWLNNLCRFVYVLVNHFLGIY